MLRVFIYLRYFLSFYLLFFLFLPQNNQAKSFLTAVYVFIVSPIMFLYLGEVVWICRLSWNKCSQDCSIHYMKVAENWQQLIWLQTDRIQWSGQNENNWARLAVRLWGILGNKEEGAPWYICLIFWTCKRPLQRNRQVSICPPCVAIVTMNESDLHPSSLTTG